jgi:hypothetical protein
MAQAPIVAIRFTVAPNLARIIPDPRRKGIKPERGQIVAKMRDRFWIVNGGLRCPLRALRQSGSLLC